MPSYRIFQCVRPNIIKSLYSKPQLKDSKLKTSNFVFSPFPTKWVKPLQVVKHKTVNPK